MSLAIDVIGKLSARGVEFRAIADCVLRPHGIRWGDHAEEEFQYIDLTSVDRVTHRIVETATITSETAPSRAQQVVRAGDVIFGTTRPTLQRYAAIPAEYDGQICSTGYCVLRPDTDVLLTNYLFHLLGTKDFNSYVKANERGASYPGISDSLVKSYRIPVPPLEVQKEIVKVLDGFRELEAELEVELEAELEARRRQYGHCRDSLFDSAEGAGGWRKMGEVGTFTRGRRFTKDDLVPEGIGGIHYGDIYTRYGSAATEAVSRVRPELAPNLRFAQSGDLVIAAVSETVEDVCKAVAWLGEEDVAVHDDCFIFRHSLNPKFASYYFQTNAFHAEKAKHVARAKVKRVSGESLASLKIPLPSIAEQERIVETLDKFDALVNDLSIGLPAELNARRKQYEYYRDMLLTFPEAA